MNKFLLVWQLMHWAVFDLSQRLRGYVSKVLLPALVKNGFLADLAKGQAVSKSIDRHSQGAQLDKGAIGSWPADYFMMGISGCLFGIALNSLSIAVGVNIVSAVGKGWFVLFFVIVALVVNYLTLWRGDRYLTFLEDFSGRPRSERIRARWLTASVSAAVLVLFVSSFVAMSKVGV